MYANVRRYTVVSGGNQKLAGRVEQEFVPIISALPGFVSYTAMAGEPENGRDVLLTISVFHTREAADESVKRAAEWVQGKLPELDASKPQITAGEVLVSTVSGPS
jgi:heme-degrading monooxygenase HmoA